MATTGYVRARVKCAVYLGFERTSLIATLLIGVVVFPWQEARGQRTVSTVLESPNVAESSTPDIPRKSFELSKVAKELEQDSPEEDGVSSPIELTPFVLSASRHDEAILTAPASISVVSSGKLAREGVPSTATSMRTMTGVDFQQAGILGYLIAVRGFNRAFESNTYVMVDHRDAYNPALPTVIYSRLPIDVLDVARIEVVRGPASAVYGAGVDQGVIHFITKDPFAYPGSSISLCIGEQSLRQVSFRQAGVVGDKLGYKITGFAMTAEDWRLDPADDHDETILDAIEPVVYDPLDGSIARILNGRDYDVYGWNLAADLHYRFDEDTRLIAHADYVVPKKIMNATLGEIQVNGPALLTGQLRFESGPFDIQAYGVKEFVDGNNWFYRAQNVMYGFSSEINVQGQYRLELPGNNDPIVFGGDYRLTSPKSKGTISGRFEDEDMFSVVGGYLQGTVRLTESLDFKASGRIDYNGASGQWVFSPRAAFVYQPVHDHTFRLTYNRAFARPTATYFNDLQVGDYGAFRVRYVGGAFRFSFLDPPQTSSFIGPGRDPGIGLATTRVYEALASGVAEDLQQDDPSELRELLRGRTAAIEGFSDGIMALSWVEGKPLGVVEALPQWQEDRLRRSDTFEVGYKGVWGGQFLIGIDGYYTRKNDFVFNQVLSPFVGVSGETLATNLGDVVRSAFTEDELASFGIDVETLATSFAEASAAFANTSIGIIEPEENYNPDMIPEMVITSLNAGSLDYFGADLSVEAYLTERWSAYANYSWVSENYFDEDALGQPGTGFVVSMNSPGNKIRAGVTYKTPKGLSLSCDVRYVGSFSVADGPYYNGVIEAYTLVDAGLSYGFMLGDTRMRLSLTAQNVFDHLHREYIGFPKIGRLVSSRLTCEF